MFKYPYGNLHGLNLDWLLNEWKKFQNSFTSAFTATMTKLPVTSDPDVDVTYDTDTGIYNFAFGLPEEVKPQSFQIGYAESASGTIIPTGVTWLENPPAVAQGNYLWSRTMVIYNDGSYSATYSCSRMGVDGQGSPATTVPLTDGVGAVGTSINFARADHVHPTDTSRASADDVLNLQNDVSAMQTDISNLQGDVSDLQNADTTMQTDISDLQGDVSDLQNADTTMQTDISDLQGDVSDLQTEVAGLGFLVDMVSGGAQATNASGYYSGSFSAVKVGYTPIGIVGFNMATTYVSAPTVQISGTNVLLEVRALGNGVVSFTPTVWVLYKKS